MTIKRIAALIFCVWMAAGNGPAWAQDTANPLPEFTSHDRVLIVAPHPDDETLGTGGVIQRAVNSGADVHVAWLTNGDSNELAFIVYERRLTFRSTEFLHMGGVRRKEAVLAMKSLGIPEANLVFLGYPDFGTMSMFRNYWGGEKPFRSLMTRVKSVPYPESPSYGAPYKGESILNDFKTILKTFQPTKIFVTLPSDTNVDHRAANLFLQVALWDLEGVIPAPEVFPFLIHVPRWPLPRGFHPELAMEPPESFARSRIVWQKMNLSEEEIVKKHGAISLFESQIAYNPPYLYTFVRHNELFGTYPVIALPDRDGSDIVWEDIESQMPIEGHVVDEDQPQNQHIDSVAYAQKDGFLYVRVRLRNWKSEIFGTDLYLFGYKKGVDFGRMPKVRVHLRWPSLCVVYDKRHHIHRKELKAKFGDKMVEVEVPLSALGNPDYILSSASGRSHGLTQDTTAWRILKPAGFKRDEEIHAIAAN
ncbi:MAG: PIG-L family deacetylase [Candidatus Omnitrophica bacterium]|nr:PIG-L family deacetylase [Candidatus Omnitrophota bacterium]